MTSVARQEVKRILSELVLSVIDRHQVAETKGQYNPFRKRIIRGDLWRLPKFERSFVTSMGSRGFEEIARIMAQDAGNYAERQHTLNGTITEGQAATINRILQELRENRRRPNWSSEVEEILRAGAIGDTIEVRIISDLYVRTLDGTEKFYSMKSPKPNLDQTEKAKQDCLYLKAADATYRPHYAMPYNPYGEDRAEYSWSYAERIFDVHGDSVVVIGREFWDDIGGAGAYEDLLDVFDEVGRAVQPRLDDFFDA